MNRSERRKGSRMIDEGKAEEEAEKYERET